MNFIISASTDVGIKKDTNQDSLTVKTIVTRQGRMAFALLCDGMGGLAKGEVASATVVAAFDAWVQNRLPAICEEPIEDHIIRREWESLVCEQNKTIMRYGKSQGISLGTTVVAMLITDQRFYIMNIGDSRAYEIADHVRQLTTDQTFVAQEVAMGRMTEEEARIDPRRNVLLQCCGASEHVFPEMVFGTAKADAVYMLCSDGFRHVISTNEIYDAFRPGALLSQQDMETNALALIELNKQRNETDNISVALVRTF